MSDAAFDLSRIPPDAPEDNASLDAVPPRKKRHRAEPAPMVLNIVSMIDVIFLLMTYFLLTAKFATREESFEVRVPEALEGTAVAPPADPFELPATTIVLLVTSRGNGVDDFAVFCDSPALGEEMPKGGAITSYDALATRAGAARGGVLGDDQRFIVRPAADARWEHALGVLNAVKRAGYNNVRFAAPARAGDPGGT